MDYFPRIVSWNITNACNLRCPHCYLDAGRRYPGELTTEDAFQLIHQMAQAGTELLILTGGEPLLRKDLPALARQASDRGISVVLGTSGTLITREVAKNLKESGVAAAGISIDSLESGKHDSFRGMPGAWQRAIRGIEACREVGIDVLVHTTALKMNYDQIPGLVKFAHERGARAFHLFFLICTGRGERLTDLSPQEYEALLGFILDSQERYPDMMVRARCAPYIRRLALQRGSMLRWSAGCLAGTSYCRITSTGDVTPCPYLPIKAGNVRERNFLEIWQSADPLARFRRPQLKGKCGQCPFSQGDNSICVGCRARAFALTEDDLAEDPWCLYQPPEVTETRETGSVPRTAQGDPAHAMPLTWTGEALERIGRIPFFIRGRVKDAAEAYAQQFGLTQVTPEVLEHLRQRAYHTKQKTYP